MHSWQPKQSYCQTWDELSVDYLERQRVRLALQWDEGKLFVRPGTPVTKYGTSCFTLICISSLLNEPGVEQTILRVSSVPSPKRRKKNNIRTHT